MDGWSVRANSEDEEDTRCVYHIYDNGIFRGRKSDVAWVTKHLDEWSVETLAKIAPGITKIAAGVTKAAPIDDTVPVSNAPGPKVNLPPKAKLGPKVVQVDKVPQNLKIAPPAGKPAAQVAIAHEKMPRA